MGKPVNPFGTFLDTVKDTPRAARAASAESSSSPVTETLLQLVNDAPEGIDERTLLERSHADILEFAQALGTLQSLGAVERKGNVVVRGPKCDEVWSLIKR
jgi:hypothetical protein